MKSTKTNKGITLVALIITIVVLLILAAVAISSISNDGILHYAQNASDAYNQAQRNEAGILDGYVEYLNQLNNKTCSEHQWTGGGWDGEAHVDEETGDVWGEYRPTQCSICGLTCNHPGDWIESWEVWDEYECVVSYYCSSCDMLFDEDSGYSTDAHDYSGGTCTKCGNVCEEHSLNDHYDNSTDTECILTYYCDYCDYWEETTSEHDYLDDGFCMNCGCECPHDVWNSEDGICSKCGQECEHESWSTTYDGEGLGDWHQPIDTCENCGMVYSDPLAIEECQDTDGDGLCDKCGNVVCDECQDTDEDGYCDNCGLEI